MNADKALELARLAYPNNEKLRVAYMLGLNKGFEVCEEQMMRDAVEGIVERSTSGKAISVKHECGGYYWAFGNDVAKQFNLGDKVKLIVIKED